MSGAASSQSLAVRLGVLAAAGSLVALALAGFVMATLQRAGAERAFDERLAVFVTQLLADYANDRVADATAHFANPAFGQPGSGWYWSVADPATGEPLLASASLFDPLPPPAPALAAEASLVTRTLPLAGTRARLAERVFAIDGTEVLVRVSAPTTGLDAEVRGFQLALLATLGAMWLALVGLSYLQVRIGLRPLDALRAAVADVREARTQTVEGRFPREVSPLVDELNAMIASNAEIIARARHHVGNLAHALKTPLAVILNASAGAQDTPQALSRVHEEARAIDARVRLYLDRAQRAARQSTAGQATALADVVDPLVRVMRKLYQDRDLSIAARLEPGARVRVERHDLEEALGNLIDNACRHARGAVLIGMQEQAGMTQVHIDDDGPGLSKAERQTVLRRGARLDEAQPGSGLGLAISQETATLYGGDLTLSTAPSGGLRVTVSLPRAAPVPPES